MTWQEARRQIEQRVLVGTDVNTGNSQYRNILSCDTATGLVVRIGKRNSIRIPWEMLRICYMPIQQGTVYDGVFFRTKFTEQAYNHPCYVHVVGQVFVKAGLAIQTDRKYICFQN